MICFALYYANSQVEKKEKPEEDEPEADAAADAAGDDAASERVLSRREEKAPARDREQPTTGEDSSFHSASGGGLDETPSLGEVPTAPAPASESLGQAPSESGKTGGLLSRFTESMKK